MGSVKMAPGGGPTAVVRGPKIAQITLIKQYRRRDRDRFF